MSFRDDGGVEDLGLLIDIYLCFEVNLTGVQAPRRYEVGAGNAISVNLARLTIFPFISGQVFAPPRAMSSG